MPDTVSSPYVTTLRVVINASSDQEAWYLAETMRQEIVPLLNVDDADERVEVTQVTNFTTHLVPLEVVERLRIARNLLIHTRLKECLNVARELDQCIWVLKHRREDMWEMGDYPWDRWQSLVLEVQANQEPTDY